MAQHPSNTRDGTVFCMPRLVQPPKTLVAGERSYQTMVDAGMLPIHIFSKHKTAACSSQKCNR